MRLCCLFVLAGCSGAPDDDVSDAASPGDVAWIRGGEDHLEVGVSGPVTEVLVDGPDRSFEAAVAGDRVRLDGLQAGTWTVRAAGRDEGLTQRVGSRLEPLGHVTLAAAADVKGDGDRLVVAGGQRPGAATATVIDISDPTTPEVMWTLEGFGVSRDAALAGRYLYLALECACVGDPEAREAWDEVGLRVVDLEAAGGPEVVGELAEVIGGIHNVTVHGDVLYLSDNRDDVVQIVDVSDPTDPVLVGAWGPAEGIVHDQTVAADGQALWVATWKGMARLDLSSPTEPVADFDQPLALKAVHQIWPLPDGEHALVTSEIAGGHLTVWHVDGGEAEQVGQAAPFPAGMVHNVVALGGRAYAAWYLDGLVMLDVSDPRQPWVIDEMPTGELGPEPTPADGPFVGAFGVWVDPASPNDGPHLVAVSDTHGGLHVVRAWPEVVWYPRDDSNVRPTD